jgi:DNA-binding NtrC family response regulator
LIYKSNFHRIAYILCIYAAESEDNCFETEQYTRAGALSDLAPTVAEIVRYRLDRAAKESGTLPPLEAMLDDLERAAITKALELCEGNRSRAASMLSISRAAMIRKLAALGL